MYAIIFIDVIVSSINSVLLSTQTCKHIDLNKESKSEFSLAIKFDTI